MACVVRRLVISRRPFGIPSTRLVASIPVSCLRTAVSHYRVGSVASLHIQAWPGVRQLSTAAKESAQGADTQTGRTADPTDEQAAEDESYYTEQEPLAAKISRNIWLGMKMSLGIGILSIVGYAGYTIVTALLPGGASANAVMRKASDILRADPEVGIQQQSTTMRFSNLLLFASAARDVFWRQYDCLRAGFWWSRSRATLLCPRIFIRG
jgi:hypothetical protein